MEVLDELQKTIEGLTGSLGAAVVGIGHRWGAGSGVVVGSGQILTNAHNIRDGEVTVTFADGRSQKGRPAGIDIDGDLAVVSAETDGIAPVAWGSADAPPQVGAPVFALANPGGRGLRVTFGLVSGTERSFRGPRGRRISGSIEHTAPLLPGSSGGPIVDSSGRLLGINTNRLGEGFYLAIPADAALRERVDALARGQSTARPRLGIGIAPSYVAKGLRRAVGLPEVDGLLVRFVEEHSAAADAGLQEGDLIVAAGDRPLADVDELHGTLEALKPGASLELKVLRGAEERTVTVKLPVKLPGGGSDA